MVSAAVVVEVMAGGVEIRVSAGPLRVTNGTEPLDACAWVDNKARDRHTYRNTASIATRVTVVSNQS